MRRLGAWGLGCVAATSLACGSSQDAVSVASNASGASSRAPRGVAATAKYRFARPPVVVFVSDDAGSSGDFWVFVRMNRALPRDAHGVRATFHLDGGTRPFGRPVTNSRKPPCYSVAISAGDNPNAPANIVNPQDGELVNVTLRFPGHSGGSAAVAARGVPRSAVGLDRTNVKYLRRLGCRVSTKVR
jgi:hypothetical protein